MKRIYISGLIALFISIIVSACITSSNPGQSNVVMHPGELKIFSVSVSSGTSAVVWHLDGVQVSSNYQTSCELSFSESDIGEHTLRVATHIQGRFPSYHSWTISVEPTDDSVEMVFKVSVNKQAHIDYGLSYPVTYRFRLPEYSSNIKVFSKWERNASWTQIGERSVNDFYNGISAVRFDYPAGFAYVSVPFSAVSDTVYLDFRDEADQTLAGIVFSKITEYYDGRKAVVTTTQDDWNDTGNDAFLTACAKQRQRKIWLSPGIITEAVSSKTWIDIQNEVDEGYVEPVSHSKKHLSEVLFCVLATDEIGGSLMDMENNLELPAFNKSGSSEYVYAWLEPFSLSCDATRQEIGKNKYLIDRNSDWGATSWAGWDSINGCYARVGFTIRMGTDAKQDVSVLNTAFDNAYENGGIYHLSYHPWALGDAEWAAYGEPHLDYIKEKKDVWYVSFGHLYLYHYMQERGIISVSTEAK